MRESLLYSTANCSSPIGSYLRLIRGKQGLQWCPIRRPTTFDYYYQKMYDLAMLWWDAVPKYSKSWHQICHFLYHIAEKREDEADLIFVWFIGVITDVLWVLGESEAADCLDDGLSCACVPLGCFGIDEDNAADFPVDHLKALVPCSACSHNAQS